MLNQPCQSNDSCPCHPCQRLAAQLDLISDYDDEPGQARQEILDAEIAAEERALTEEPTREWFESYPAELDTVLCEVCHEDKMLSPCRDCVEALREETRPYRERALIEEARLTEEWYEAADLPF